MYIAIFYISACREETSSRTERGSYTFTPSANTNNSCSDMPGGTCSKFITNYWQALDIKYLLQKYKSSTSLKDFENKLNDQKNPLHNIDSNRDRKLDYIKLQANTDIYSNINVELFLFNKKTNSSTPLLHIVHTKVSEDELDIIIIGNESSYKTDSIYQSYLLTSENRTLFNEIISISEEIDINNSNKFNPVRTSETNNFIRTHLATTKQFYPLFIGLHIPILLTKLKASINIEDFEKKINSLEQKENNLDLNYDGFVDFLYVDQKKLSNEEQQLSISFYDSNKTKQKLLEIILKKAPSLGDLSLVAILTFNQKYWGHRNIFKRIIKNSSLLPSLFSTAVYKSPYSLNKKASFFRSEKKIASVDEYNENYFNNQIDDDIFLDYGIDPRILLSDLMKSDSLSIFERKINEEKYHLLDTNNDKYIDYISVYESKLENNHIIELRIKENPDNIKIATLVYSNKKFSLHLKNQIFWPDNFFTTTVTESEQSYLKTYLEQEHTPYQSPYSNDALPENYTRKKLDFFYDYYDHRHFKAYLSRDSIKNITSSKHNFIYQIASNESTYDKRDQDLVDSVSEENFRQQCNQMNPRCYVADNRVYYNEPIHSRSKRCLSHEYNFGDKHCDTISANKFDYVFEKDITTLKNNILNENTLSSKKDNFIIFLRNPSNNTCLDAKDASNDSSLAFLNCDYSSDTQKFSLVKTTAKNENDSFFQIKNLSTSYCLSQDDDDRTKAMFTTCINNTKYQEKRKQDFISQAFLFSL